jgi:hypothetical protein
MEGTVWKSGCASWYLNSAGYNSTLWPGFTFEYRRRTRRFDTHNYVLTRRDDAAGQKALVASSASAPAGGGMSASAT